VKCVANGTLPEDTSYGMDFYFRGLFMDYNLSMGMATATLCCKWRYWKVYGDVEESTYKNA